jgi:hypothetical protein
MRKIVFIGQIQNVEFASRWRRELASLDVEEGRKLSKQIKQSYSLSDESPVPGKVMSPKDREQNRLRENIYKEKTKAGKKRQSFKIDKTPISSKRTRSDKLAQLQILKENRANKIIDKTVDDFNNAAKAPSNTSSQYKSIKTKMDFDFSGVGNEPKWDKTKLKKAGLGAAGLLTAGAIGYGVYRKMRSDKGKKRGNYRK